MSMYMAEIISPFHTFLEDLWRIILDQACVIFETTPNWKEPAMPKALISSRRASLANYP